MKMEKAKMTKMKKMKRNVEKSRNEEIDDRMIEICEYLMKEFLAAGADDVVLHASRGFGQHTKFANNSIAKTGTEEIHSIGIFTAWKGRIVETTLKEFTKEVADKTIKKAVTFARQLPVNKNYCGIAEGPFRYKSLPYDGRIAKFGEKHADIITDAINAAIEEGAKKISGVLETYDWETHLFTSHNVDAYKRGSSIYYSVRAFVDREASGHRVACGRSLKNINFEKTTRDAAQIAVDAKNPIPGPCGRFDLVFDPLPLANLLESVGSAASAFEVDAGFSFLAKKLGKTVASNCVTLMDDATLPTGFNSTPFDAEGVPTKKTTIIKDGKLHTYLHNTSTALRYGTKTTANAGLIAPHHWNLVLKPGDRNLDELFAEVRNGMYITNIWYTRFQNYVKGDFSTLPRDGIFLIENGKISNPLKSVRISSNMLDFLKNITAVGKESVNIHSWEVSSSVITPPILVKNITITKPIA
jgi:PmbA protein